MSEVVSEQKYKPNNECRALQSVCAEPNLLPVCAVCTGCTGLAARIATTPYPRNNHVMRLSPLFFPVFPGRDSVETDARRVQAGKTVPDTNVFK